MDDAAMNLEACPYLRGSPGKLAKGLTHAVYCRQPDGTVRVPSRDETARFCTTGRQRECPGYPPMPLDDMFATGQS
jgi:hypothetical protein